MAGSDKHNEGSSKQREARAAASAKQNAAQKTAARKQAGTCKAVAGRRFETRKETVQERREELRAKATERANEEKHVGSHEVRYGDILKAAGLVAFLLLILLACWFLWPYIHDLFEPGGVDRVISDVRDAGPAGVLILLALQFLQIVVAFIPGEATQMAAGMLYGPWLGALVILIGCIISSAFVFLVVHKLGAPFVKDMVSDKWLSKFQKFEASGKLDITVFILFLIPAMPKDVFTYLVPLTDMPMRKFLLLSNVGRIPGILISTYAASGLVDGNVWQSIVIFAVLAVVAVVCIVFRERIMAALEKLGHK